MFRLWPPIRRQAWPSAARRARSQPMGPLGTFDSPEDNCHGECEGCNGPHGCRTQIEAGAIARIGPERYAELCADNTPHKWQRDELTAIRTYRAKLKELKGEHADARTRIIR